MSNTPPSAAPYTAEEIAAFRKDGVQSVACADCGVPQMFDVDRWLATLDALDAITTDTEKGDGPCRESDGCPTEMVVLQRFWRKHRQAALSAEPGAGPVAWMVEKQYEDTKEWGIYALTRSKEGAYNHARQVKGVPVRVVPLGPLTTTGAK